MTTTVPTVHLNDGTTIPQLGFGVFLVPPAETQATVEQALEVGYRHLDTAQMYGNEAGVGAAIAASGIPRDEMYVTTKLNNGFHRPDDARRAFAETLEKLGLDRVDLFLIHWPLPTRYDGDYVSTWSTLVELQKEGGTASVGVSNFEPDHLSGSSPRPARARGQPDRSPPVLPQRGGPGSEPKHGVATEAWSPIARGRVNDDPTIGEIAARVGRTPAQVTLRWHLQRGDIVFPKSMKGERMRENFDVFGFELSNDDITTLGTLDEGESGRTGPNPNTFDMIPD